MFQSPNLTTHAEQARSYPAFTAASNQAVVTGFQSKTKAPYPRRHAPGHEKHLQVRAVAYKWPT